MLIFKISFLNNILRFKRMSQENSSFPLWRLSYCWNTLLQQRSMITLTNVNYPQLHSISSTRLAACFRELVHYWWFRYEESGLELEEDDLWVVHDTTNITNQWSRITGGISGYRQGWTLPSHHQQLFTEIYMKHLKWYRIIHRLILKKNIYVLL